MKRGNVNWRYRLNRARREKLRREFLEFAHENMKSFLPKIMENFHTGTPTFDWLMRKDQA